MSGPLTRPTMPYTGVELPVLAPGVVGLRYADETGVYITWIETRVPGEGRGMAYVRGQCRLGKPVFIVEVLSRSFRRKLDAAGFKPEEVELTTNFGRDVAACMVWRP